MSIAEKDTLRIGDGVLQSFIATYEGLPLLWNPSDLNYKNKMKRNSGLVKLLRIYEKIKPGATIADVRRKINTLRCNYRKELKKIEDSKRSGAGANEVYSPSSWVFHALRFIDNFEQPVNLENSGAYSDEENEDEKNENHSQIPATPSSSRLLKARSPEPTPKKARQKAYAHLDQSSKINTQTEIPTISKVWGEKLLELNPQQRAFAEKAVNDILFEASLGTLHRHSVKINEGFSYHSSTVTSPEDSEDKLAYELKLEHQ